MPLSAAEKLSCYEMLEAFWSDTATLHNGMGGVTLTLTQLDTLKDDIETRLDNLDADAVVKVQAIVTRWDRIKFSTVEMDAGETGGVSGIKLSLEKQQARLRKLLNTYVPVIHMVDAMIRAQGPTGAPPSIQINTIRC